MKKLFRFAADAYGKKGDLLPRSLDFLRTVPFRAVIEDQRGGKIELIVEVKAKHLKKMAQEIDHLKHGNQDLLQKFHAQGEVLSIYADVTTPELLEKLRIDFSNKTKELEEKKDELNDARKSSENANAQLMQLQNLFIEAYNLSEEKSPFRSFFNQEIKHRLKWPPYQGGAPGLKS